MTQFVMASDPVGRAVWREALLKAAKASTDAYRTVFFLELNGDLSPFSLDELLANLTHLFGLV